MFVFYCLLLYLMLYYLIRYRGNLEYLKRGKFMSRIEMNQKAPIFEVEDYLGNKISLKDFQGSHNVLLVFNRGFI